MANVEKLRGRRTLDAPPSLEEAGNSLSAPEHAPAAPEPARPARPDVTAAAVVDVRKIDGRTLRRSNRTVTFATKVTPEWDAEVRAIAQEDGVMLVEVLERALRAYKEARKRS